MNVTDTMRQQNERNRFRDLARVILGNFTAQNPDAVRNGLHHIPVAAPNLPVAIFLSVQHRHIRVMHPVMGRPDIAGIRAGWIRIPKIVELLFDLWMIAEMNSAGIIWTALVPTLDVICNQRSALQRDTIEKRFDFLRRWRASEFAISNGADDFVT